MYCTKCGAPNPDNAMSCMSCGTPFVNPYQSSLAGASAPGSSGQIPNYLVQAILTTVCCCLPFGIVAIVYAAQVNGKLAAGDYAGAKSASDSAKMWCWVAFGLGLVAGLFWLLAEVAFVFMGAQQHGGVRFH
jgi:hypothetical protein